MHLKQTMTEKPDKDVDIEAEKHLQSYVSLVILKVFDKCNAYKEEEDDFMLKDTHNLLNLIMKDLPKDIIPSMPCGKMAKSVHKGLVRVFGKKLKSKIREQDPDRDIIETFQRKLMKHSGKSSDPCYCLSFSTISFAFLLGEIILIAMFVLIILLP